LSATGYTVTVTDKTGDVVTKGIVVPQTPKLGLISITPTSTTCYSNNGEMLIVISGGTAPYNYLLSNGVSNINYAQFQNFTNLAAGDYKVTVIDSDYCTFTSSVSIVSPYGFTVLSTSSVDSFCETNNGSISINLIGGIPNYTYSLSGDNGTNLSQVTNRTSQIFSKLYPGNYYLSIGDFGTCVYNETITINSLNNFSISVETQDATFVGNDGYVMISVSSGSAPFTFEVTGQPTITKSVNFLELKNLVSGSYLVSVTDNSGCTVNENFFIGQIEPIDFLVYVPPTVRGKKSSIEVYITKGTPPFQVEWSNNVGGQTGLTVTDLSAGTYTVKVTDNNGSTQTRSTTFSNVDLISSYLVYNVCDSNINDTATVVKKGLKEMLVEGYLNLTQDDVNCTLNSAVFNTVVELAGNTYQDSFYTSNSLTDYPFDNDFYLSAENILLNINGIDNVEFNSQTNQVRINTGCSNQSVSLLDQPIVVNVLIQYDISCENCGGGGNIPGVGADFALVSSDVGSMAFDTQGRYLYTLPASDEYISSIGITRDPSNSKVWVLDTSGSVIYEYDIETLIPFQLSFNRQISLSSTLSRSLIWYNSTTLLSYIDGSQYLSYVDILTGNVTDGLFLSTTPSTVVSKSVLVNSVNKIIIILTNVTGSHLLVQFDTNGNSEVKFPLPVSLSGFTMFEDSGVFYVINLDDLNVYSVDSSPPYDTNYCYTLETPQLVTYLYMTQINTYVTTNFS
jgi:hypothetical protein